MEFDLARVEAMKVVGLYIAKDNARRDEFRRELERIARDDEEDQMVRGWAERARGWLTEP
jgi:hypothetical protein